MAELEPVYLLHKYAYQCHHALLKCLTPNGLLTAVARDVKRPKSSWRGVLEPFNVCWISTSGRGEVKTVRKVETVTAPPRLSHVQLCSGLYINELLLHVMQPDLEQGCLFEGYAQFIQELPNDTAQALRRFELLILHSMGVAPVFMEDADGEPIEMDAVYLVMPGSAPQRLASQEVKTEHQVHGATLYALLQGQWEGREIRAQSKRLLANWLNVYTQGRAQKARDKLRVLVN